MSPRPALLVALLAGLSLPGCLTPGTPADAAGPRSGEQNDGRGLWGGSTLEGVECDGLFAASTVRHEPLDALLPPNATPQGSIVAFIQLDLWSCRALVLEDGPPLADSWLYLVSTRLADDEGRHHVYVLEMGSDHALILEDAAARGVPTVHAQFRRQVDGDVTSIHITADDIRYTVQAPEPEVLQETDKPVPRSLYGGPDNDLLLHQQFQFETQDAYTYAGLLHAEGGSLGALHDAGTVPLVVGHNIGGFLLSPPSEQ